jgi:hypothetical protein
MAPTGPGELPPKGQSEPLSGDRFRAVIAGTSAFEDEHVDGNGTFPDGIRSFEWRNFQLMPGLSFNADRYVLMTPQLSGVRRAEWGLLTGSMVALDGATQDAAIRTGRT